jgi:hypothetical protein
MVRINGRQLAAGASITIDGGSGEVFEGQLAGHWEKAPEVVTLLDWARELGVEIEPAAEDQAAATRPSRATGDLVADDVQRALLIRGAASPEQLSEALTTAPDQVQPLLDQLAGLGLATGTEGSWRLSATGKLAALELVAADRAAVGEPQAAALLDQFDALDQRMKEIVTAWQLRDAGGGEQVVNDHSDAAYDERVLADLAGLAGDTAEWLTPLVPALPRFEVYRSRLRAALDKAAGGDGRFVASPRVDSYHGIWFELHEDLIRLAGRQREA